MLNKNLIPSLIFFIVIASGVMFLTFSTGKSEENNNYLTIKVLGNKLISAEDYLIFTKLKNNPEKFNIAIVRDRFEKHPYIDQVNAKIENGILNIQVKEKRINALVISSIDQLLITDRFELLPVFSQKVNLNLPVLFADSINVKESFAINNQVKCAFKIIEAAKLTNKSLSDKISEINIRDANVELSLSGIKPKVLLGMGNEVKKIFYLDILLEGVSGSNRITDSSDYIDLRYKNEIYAGNFEKPGTI